MRKYVCGRCYKGYDDLGAFGDHGCTGFNPFLAALGGSINLPDFSIDLSETISQALEKHEIDSAISKLEGDLRRGDLS
jgi:hypothetical protein